MLNLDIAQRHTDLPSWAPPYGIARGATHSYRFIQTMP